MAKVCVDKPIMSSSDHKSPLPMVSSLDPPSSDDEEKFGMPRIELKKTPTVDISVPSPDNSTERARTSDLTAKNKNTFIDVNLRSVSPNLNVCQSSLEDSVELEELKTSRKPNPSIVIDSSSPQR